MSEPIKREIERRLLASYENTHHLATWFDVTEAMADCGMSDMHIKTLARKGKIKAVKVRLPGGPKWLIEPESLRNYVPRSSSPTGMRRLVFRYHPDAIDIEDVKAHLQGTYGDSSDHSWTLTRQKSAKSTKKRKQELEDFIPELLSTYSGDDDEGGIEDTEE